MVTMSARWAPPYMVMLASIAPVQSHAQSTVETIVMVRHGEKPVDEVGQLNCQGLSRALQLPAVLIGKYGRPTAIFAPNPAEQIIGNGVGYDYVRPLATIEPTAVALGMPVRADIGYRDVGPVSQALTGPDLNGATVFVAWEHIKLVAIAKQLLDLNGGDSSKVPTWSEDDYDTIFVIRITRSPSGKSASLEMAQEGLNGVSATLPGCPAPSGAAQ